MTIQFITQLIWVTYLLSCKLTFVTAYYAAFIP